MNKWVEEDWEFTIKVIDGVSKNCRLGFEKNDTFCCCYEVPTRFCPKTMPVLYTLCEIIRCGGSFKSKGSDKDNEINFTCADGMITFHLSAKHL